MQRDRGENDEIEFLYRQHGSALLLFAEAMTGERDRAQEAVHQVFLNLIERGNVSQATDKKAYLFVCIRNAVLNEVKVRRRHMPLDPESAWFIPPDRDFTGELNLRRALCALPEDQRDVVVLHIWGDLTFSQVGDVLDISSNTAASRYRYALAKLRESMCSKEDRCAKS